MAPSLPSSTPASTTATASPRSPRAITPTHDPVLSLCHRALRPIFDSSKHHHHRLLLPVWRTNRVSATAAGPTPLPSCSVQACCALAMATGRGDATSMVAVGLVWGATNALMRQGALVWDRCARASPSGGNVFWRWAALLLTRQYSAPFTTNLCASAAFFVILGAAPISMSVPITNVVTFAATTAAAAAVALGERVRPAPAVLGTVLIVLGAWVCIFQAS